MYQQNAGAAEAGNANAGAANGADNVVHDADYKVEDEGNNK